MPSLARAVGCRHTAEVAEPRHLLARAIRHHLLLDGVAVPAEAEAKVCIRAPETEQLEALKEHVLALQTDDTDVKLEITAEVNRPVFPRLQGTVELFKHAREICRKIGFDLEERHSGGGSDGNFTAALGIPTLDGLGADGHGHHTQDEYILFSSLKPRARMWVQLLQTLI